MDNETSALNNIATFDTWADDYYQPATIRYYDAAIKHMLRWLAPPAGGTVLDAGCGTGVHSMRVAEAGFKVNAVDISPVALERARQSARTRKLAHQIDFDQGDLTRLAFPNNSFDAVFSWGVVIHIEDVESALAELVRVLKPGGRVALQVTNMHALDHKFESLARFVLRKPKAGEKRSAFGVGAWEKVHGGNLYTIKMDIPHLTKQMRELGCRRLYRGVAEASEIQCRLSGGMRYTLLQMNRLYFALGLPARPACTNLLVFEKAKSLF